MEERTELPEGLTCAECTHCERCGVLFGHRGPETECMWNPSRFRVGESVLTATRLGRLILGLFEHPDIYDIRIRLSASDNKREYTVDIYVYGIPGIASGNGAGLLEAFEKALPATDTGTVPAKDS